MNTNPDTRGLTVAVDDQIEPIKLPTVHYASWDLSCRGYTSANIVKAMAVDGEDITLQLRQRLRQAARNFEKLLMDQIFFNSPINKNVHSAT